MSFLSVVRSMIHSTVVACESCATRTASSGAVAGEKSAPDLEVDEVRRLRDHSRHLRCAWLYLSFALAMVSCSVDGVGCSAAILSLCFRVIALPTAPCPGDLNRMHSSFTSRDPSRKCDGLMRVYRMTWGRYRKNRDEGEKSE